MRVTMKLFLVVCWFGFLANASLNASDGIRIPDFTKGDVVPEGAMHDWNLGPTGTRGWIFCDQLVTTDARQILITKVAQGSPATGIIEVGDVILGVGGKPFSYDPRTEFGQAVSQAESDRGAGKLSLTVWRNGNVQERVVTLPVLGNYSPTAPYDCPKSKRILEQGCQSLASRIPTQSYQKRTDPIVRSLNALALLASGDPVYQSIVASEAQWAASYSNKDMRTWYYGYVMLFLAEYSIATGDQSVIPGLRRLAIEAAKGQSNVGSWGHNFAIPDGRLGGYGMMNSPGIPLTIGLVLARKAGVDAPEVELAIQRSTQFLRFYIRKGAIPYGDHHPWIETHEDNGKCGMAAVLFNLLDEREGAEFYSRMCVASHGSERDTGHTGNYFNILWAMPGVSLSGPNASGAWMKQFGSWYFDLARGWNNRFVHQGPPEMEPDSYAGWDSSGTYLLAYAMPLKKTFLTGKGMRILLDLDVTAADRLIQDGMGWTNKDRKSDYDRFGEEEIIERLQSWSPIVRERAALAVGRRKDVPLERIVQMLTSEKIESRYGACQVIQSLGSRGALAIDSLLVCLSDDDLWLRIKAADALASIGRPAQRTVPQLLERLAQVDSEKDPRGMQQRYMAFALFDDNGMLSRSLAGVDRQALYTAVRAGLRNQDGRARGTIGSVYRNLSTEEVKPLLPAVYEAVVQPAPSGEMFADTIRVEGLRLLAKHRIQEGLLACVEYTRNQNPWASEHRTPELMEILLSYGTHAKSVVPELNRLANYFESEEEDFPKELMRKKAKCVRDTIKAIEAAKETPILLPLQ
jgi:hypothetical protein